MTDETPVIYRNGIERRREQGDATLDVKPVAGNGNP
jgi:hypothetical protein